MNSRILLDAFGQENNRRITNIVVLRRNQNNEVLGIIVLFMLENNTYCIIERIFVRSYDVLLETTHY